MARWRLTVPHYITVEGNAWEQVEVDRMTGKQIRKRYPVPMLLDINDPGLWNDNIIRNPRGEVLAGDIVVALKDTEHHSNDYIFTGDPGPDMFPIDSEAEAISKKFETVWKAAPSEDVTYSERLMRNVQEEQAKVQAEASKVQVEGLGDVLKIMSEMLAQNQALIATLVSANAAKPERRV